VIWIFLGPAFTAAEFAGGFVLILMWAAVHLFVSDHEEERAREHAREAATGHQHTIAGGRRALRKQLTSVQAWSDVAHNFRGDWQMLWKEITAGFLIAGFVSLVPRSIFEAAFLQDAPAAVRTVENVLVGPLIAILSFVCSVGNIPLAAVLWAGGISFAGVNQTPHRGQRHGQPVCFCSAGCKESFDADPGAYEDMLGGTQGWRPRGLLRERM
jgi:uncharacterized membrane protein YraQ (UPF0718 family)/YHS domain-containing protein